MVDPKEISGFEGDTVSLQCTYGEELKKHQKYWCREAGLFISRCAGTVFSGEYGQEGRVSVHDNPRENRFTVILRNLTLKDMGKYWCGVKKLGFDKTMSVSLLVFPGNTHPSFPGRDSGAWSWGQGNCTSPQQRTSLVAQRLKRLPAMPETWVQSLGREVPLEKEIATHSSILAWEIHRGA